MRAITFHGLGEPPSGVTSVEAPYWVAVDRFRELMDRMSEYANYQITFDDGNRSDFEIATPILRERGLRATFFVLTGRLGKHTALAPEHLREMYAAGMAIGSHGFEHRDWTKLSEAELDEELSRSKRVLSDALGQAVDRASCPFGKYNGTVLRVLKRHGYRRVYTCDGGWVPSQPWLVHRWNIMRHDSLDVLDKLLRPSLPRAAWQQTRQVYRRLKTW